MAQTIKIPGIGPVQSKWALAGAALVIGIAGFAWWRYLQGGGAAADDEPAVADFTEGGDYVYGDPGLASWSSESYGGGAYPYPSGGTNYWPPPTGVQTATPVTNPEWTSRAIEHLQLVGAESQVASLAVSRYLLKECLTATQADLTRQAVAALGPPPQSGPYSIIICQGAPPPSGGGGQPSGSTLPAPSGLHSKNTTRSTVDLWWTPVKGAAGYRVFKAIDPAGGNTPAGVAQASVLYHHLQVQGLRPGTRYRFDVHAIGADGKIGARGRYYVTTKKK